jgi:hypothetical protein
MFYTDAGRKDQALKYLEKAKALFIEMEKNFGFGYMHRTLCGLHKNEGNQFNSKQNYGIANKITHSVLIAKSTIISNSY